MSEQRLADAFIEMADTLVDDFDVIDFLHLLTDRCVGLLDITAAGLLLTDQHDALRVVAASSEQTRLLELFQLQTDEGPCLDCFRTGHTQPGALIPETIRLGQALADIATIGLLQERAIRRRETLAEQLQTALTSRVLIEQAKGIIAERHQIDMDQAFSLLRHAARNRRHRLSDLATAIVTGSEDL